MEKKRQCSICKAKGDQLEYKGWVYVTKDNWGLKEKTREAFNNKILCYQCIDLFNL